MSSFIGSRRAAGSKFASRLEWHTEGVAQMTALYERDDV